MDYLVNVLLDFGGILLQIIASKDLLKDIIRILVDFGVHATVLAHLAMVQVIKSV
jgi:hypothetical protein